MKYVAFLRGIGPGNPNMRNDKLRGVFEELSFSNVRSVISSGNIIFESNSKDIARMEAKIEAAWPKRLGFTSTTIIRSQKQLEDLVALDPFKGLTHGPSSYLLVTFFKKPQKMPFELPFQPDNRPYYLPISTDQEVFSVTDNTNIPTTDLMTWLERQFGKEISSRTWKTVQRILAKF